MSKMARVYRKNKVKSNWPLELAVDVDGKVVSTVCCYIGAFHWTGLADVVYFDQQTGAPHATG
jgi:hypothetical protein